MKLKSQFTNKADKCLFFYLHNNKNVKIFNQNKKNDILNNSKGAKTYGKNNKRFTRLVQRK